MAGDFDQSDTDYAADALHADVEAAIAEYKSAIIDEIYAWETGHPIGDKASTAARAALLALYRVPTPSREAVEKAISVYVEAASEACHSAQFDSDTTYGKKANIADSAYAALLALIFPQEKHDA